MSDVEEPITQDELEHLFVNNEKLSRINTYLSRFNPIEIMGMQDMEIRHSAILSWLLDPRETHGLGDEFLRAFLAEAMRGQSELGSPTAIEIYEADMRDAEVRREWQNIDIFVLLPRLNWAFVIENKYHSSQHEGQLAKYAERVRDAFESREEMLLIRGVFLTLHDEHPEDESFAPIRYLAICEFLPRLIAEFEQVTRSDVKHFLWQYLEIIREAVGVSEDLKKMERLAKQLYRSHKKALDFVMAHGRTTEFGIATEAVFGEDLDDWPVRTVDGLPLQMTGAGSAQVQFIPRSWAEALGGDDYSWPGCDGWWAGWPLICWISLFEAEDGKTGNLWIYAEVGPIENHEFRKSLIEEIIRITNEKDDKNVRFQRGATEEGKRYSKFLKNNSVRIDDIHDSEKLEKGIRGLLSKFTDTFIAVSEILPQFLEYGEE